MNAWYYVILTFSMMVNRQQPGQIVTHEAPAQVFDCPLGAKCGYMQRQEIEGLLIVFRCTPAGDWDDGKGRTFQCQGMQ